MPRHFCLPVRAKDLNCDRYSCHLMGRSQAKGSFWSTGLTLPSNRISSCVLSFSHLATSRKQIMTAGTDRFCGDSSFAGAWFASEKRGLTLLCRLKTLR